MNATEPVVRVVAMLCANCKFEATNGIGPHDWHVRGIPPRIPFPAEMPVSEARALSTEEFRCRECREWGQWLVATEQA